MGVNKAENSVYDALVNRINQLVSDFNEFRTTPQRNGNGSLEWAKFVSGTIGPVNIAAGTTTYFTITFQPIDIPFTYDGKDAINRLSILDFYLDVKVDTNDAAHITPVGASLTSAQKKVRVYWRKSVANSGLSDTNGQQQVIVEVENADSSAHNYYFDVMGVIPRPALKPY